MGDRMTRLIRIMRGWPCADLAFLLVWVFLAIGILRLIAWGLIKLFGG